MPDNFHVFSPVLLFMIALYGLCGYARSMLDPDILPDNAAVLD